MCKVWKLASSSTKTLILLWQEHSLSISEGNSKACRILETQCFLSGQVISRHFSFRLPRFGMLYISLKWKLGALGALLWRQTFNIWDLTATPNCCHRSCLAKAKHFAARRGTSIIHGGGGCPWGWQVRWGGKVQRQVRGWSGVTSTRG